MTTPSTSNTVNTRQAIYLGALLHDIGKFYQRADESGATRSKILNPEIKKLEITFCPQNKGYYSHKHVLWTAQFFEDFKTHLTNLLGKSEKLGELMNLAASHHSPKNDYEKIIQKADHYSSGADRSQSEEAWKDSEEESDKNWDSFRRIKMRSVFEGVFVQTHIHRLPLTEIQTNKSFFPKTSELSEIPDYKKLWYDFTKEMKFIQTDSFKVFSETMLYLLEKYTSRIPSSTQHLPDVSLYDHSKTTAAFAVCLYDYFSENKNSFPDKNDKPFLLLGGDISGIQKFIYSIIARGAAKNLKGRSFYLQLLVDNIVKLIVDRLNLFDANVIYSSGGGFYIIAPNTDSVKKEITNVRKLISSKIFEFHKTDLSLAVDYVEFGEMELIFNKENSKAISDVWVEVSEKLSKQKSQKYIDKLEEEDAYIQFFEPQDIGGKQKKDSITGEELGNNVLTVEGKKVTDIEKSDELLLNAYTYQQIELGRKLKNADYWIQSVIELKYFEQKYFNPIDIGIFNYFVTEKDLESKKSQLKGSADNVRVLRINNLNFLDTAHSGINNIYGFTFYGGNDYPNDNFHRDAPKTFEELCGIVFKDEKKEDREKSPEIVRFGVLRMDVDNLGNIFKNGFSESKKSFSRYCTLSRSLDYFFKGYINNVWESKEDYKEYTQIIYSGGDDLFIVGKWDVLFKMAKEINKEFCEWTCNSSHFTLSGGVAVVGPKFPLLKTAIFAETEEKNAKNHKYNKIEKNAFSIFGFSFNWEKEYDYISGLKEQIKILLEQDMPQTFPSAMYNLMQQTKFIQDKEDYYKLTNYQVIWLTAYNFKRATQRINSTEIKAFFEQWVKNIFTGKIEGLNATKYHALQYLAIAARWADLELRSKI